MFATCASCRDGRGQGRGDTSHDRKMLINMTHNNMNGSKLLALVKNICSGEYTQAELVQYITLAQKIALSYLKYQEVIGKRISGERVETDIEMEDLAIDCIADLFAEDDNGGLPHLKKYYENKLAEIENPTDAEVLVLTRRLVVRKTKQELSRIFRERDPEGAKIVRNIKVAIRNSDIFLLFKEMGKEYICFRTNGHNGKDFPTPDPIFLRRSKPPIPDDLLTTRFLDVYHPNDSISSSIKKLLEAVSEYEGYQRFLALDVVSRLLRNIKYNNFRDRLTADLKSPSPLDQLEDKEIGKFLDKVMVQMWNKIHNNYCLTGKITMEKAEIYHKALRDVLVDLTQEKNGSSYFRNLKYYLPELSQKRYRQQERSIFEYLAKLAKRDYRKYLTEML